MTNGIEPSEAMTEAIAEVLETLPDYTSENIQEVLASLGRAAAMIMATTAVLSSADDALREMLTWFSEHTERDALKFYHRAKRDQDSNGQS